MVLQRFRYPQPNICMNKELYYRGDCEISEQDLVISNDKTLSFDTYFNSFSISKWLTYTNLQSLSISMDVKGSFTIDIVCCFIREDKLCKEVIKSNSYKKNNSQLDITIESNELIKYKNLDAIIFPSITVYGGRVTIGQCCYFTVVNQKTNKVTIGIDICTFKREEYVKRNVDVLYSEIINNPKSELYNNLFVHISDNGKSLEGVIEHPRIMIHPNKNLGGVGGFTRGMIEYIDNKDANGVTHVLIMDDDAIIEPYAIERNYSFLKLLKEEYRLDTIAGAMLCLDRPTMQFESGAIWNRGKIKSLNSEFDLTSIEQIIKNESTINKPDYSAWWYSCIPIDVIKESQLPLPIFIHFDDADYGMRVCNNVITLNGICVWHEEFDNKVTGVMEYYDVRNLIIVNSIDINNYTFKEFKKKFRNRYLSNLFYFKYKYNEYNLMAIDDICKGIEWLMEQDGEELNMKLIAANYKNKPLNELVNNENNYDKYVKADVKYLRGPKRIARKIVYSLFLNGWFLPSKGRGVILEAACPFYMAARRKEVVCIDKYGNGFVTNKDTKEFFRLIKEYKKSMKKLKMNYKRVTNEYNERHLEMTNIDFWRKYLGI